MTQVTATDADLPGDTLTYSLIGGPDQSRFSIDGSGNLTFSTAPDFENPTDSGLDNIYNVTVQVSDGVYTDTQSMTINVQDMESTALVVTTTSDVDDSGLGATYTIEELYAVGGGADGHISLREAMIAANMTAGEDSISFNISTSDAGYVDPDAIPGNGNEYWKITANTGYTFTDTVTIDARTQGGYANAPVIEITGDGSFNTFSLQNHSGSTIAGLSLTNSLRGVFLSGGDSHTIVGNYFGLQTDGETISGIGSMGVSASGSDNNLIGDTGVTNRNVFAGGGGNGIFIDATSDGTVIQNNYIGVNAAGDTDLGFTTAGINVSGTGTLIGTDGDGSDDSLEGNLIAGSSNNIRLLGDNTTISGNTIGSSGMTQTTGVLIGAGTVGTTIGGTAADTGNVITAHSGRGISVNGDGEVAILGNAIYGNALLPIDLNTDGPDTNDGALNPTLANDGMDAPVVTTANLDGTTLSLDGFIGVSALGDADFANARVEFFLSDGTGSSEFLGFLTADANGLFSGDLTVSGVVDTDKIIATATLGGTVTSEYGNEFDVNVAPHDLNPNSATVNENTDTSGGLVVATLLTSDVDPGDSATYSVVGGADAGVFSISGDQLVLTDGVLDHETQSSYTVRIRTTDGGGMFREEDVVVSVNDLNEAPIITGPASATVGESQSITFDAVGSGLIDTYDDDGDGLSITVTASDASITLAQTTGLTIVDGDGSDGTLSFSGSQADIDTALDGLVYQSDSGFNGVATLTIDASDGSLSDQHIVSITVNPGQTVFVWDGGGSSNDWTDADNWNHDRVPEADDVVVFNATSSKDSTLDAAFAGSISEIQVNAGYTGTLTFATGLTNTGDFIIADGTVDTNGQAIDMEGFINVTGGTLTIDGSTLNLADDFIHSGGTLNTNGSTLYFDGSGDRSLQTSAEIDNIEIDHVGALTFLSDLSFAGDFTHSQGTVDFRGHEVSVAGTTGQTVDASGLTFDDFEFNNSNTVTIVGGLDIDGDLNYTNAVTINGGNVTAAGNITTIDSVWSGTSVLTLDGTADQTISTGGGAGELGNLVINKASGTVQLVDDIELGGDFTHTSGGFDTNGQTVEFQGHNTTIDAGSLTFEDVILNSTIAGSRVIVGTLDVDGDFTFANAGTLNNGQITVAGDITYSDDSYSGTTMIIADGTGDQIVSATSGTAKAEHLTINKASGTLTFGTDLTINGTLNHVAGSVADLTHTITFGNNSGTITASSINFDDVIFDSNYSKNISGVLNVGGDLTITSVNALNVGEIRVAGNITSSDTSVGGNSQITLNGTGTQTISGDDLSDGRLNIDKTSGVAVLADDLVLNGISQDLNVISGTLDLNGHTINATGEVVIDDSLLIGTGAITNGLTLDNDAIVRLSASSTSVYESIAIGGTLTLGLGAQLELDLTGMTAGGYLQDILTSTTLAGTFDAITLLNDSVGFTVYDEYNSPTGAVDIFLNSNPTGSVSDVSVNEDAPDTVIDLDAAFSDLEHADNELTYSLIGYSNPAFLDSANIDNGAGTLTLDYAAEQHGTTTITVRATDARGEFTDVTFNVTVNSIEDAPVVTGGPATSSLTETDSGLTDAGTFTVSDSDIADNVTAAVDSVAVSGTGASSIPGSLDNATLQSFLSVSPTAILDGTETTDTLTWNFNSGSEPFDFLANGETLILTYTISATDDSASTLSDTETVTVTITGTNDTPDVFVDTGDSAAETLTETDTTLTSSGTLTVSDLDLTDSVTSSVTGVVTSGTTTGLGSDNAALLAMMSSTAGVLDATELSDQLTWNFNSGGESFDYLASGESLTLTYTIEVTDSQGATDTQNITITVNGTGDAPVITGGPDTSSLTETDSGLTDTGTLTISDLDRTDNVTAAVDSVAVSGTGASSVPGSLDNATLQSFLSVSPTAILDGTETTDTLTWDFNSGAEAFDFLADGETLILTYAVSATDDDGTPLSDTETVTVTITGTNDSPDVYVDTGDSAAETLGKTGATLTTSGTLTVDDLDLTDSVTSTVNGVAASGDTTGLASNNAELLAMLTSTANVIDSNKLTDTLNWDFNSGSETFDYLAAGESLTLTYTITVADSQSATDTQNVVITITGNNNVPVITVETGDSAAETLTETDTTLTSTGTLTVTDVNLSDTVTSTVTGVASSGTTAGLGSDNAAILAMLSSTASVLDASETSDQLTWNFNSGGESFDYLASGETLTLTYTIEVTDSQGATDTQNVTITVNGTGDAPVITGGPDTSSLTETDSELTDTGTFTIEDLDRSDNVTAAVDSVAVSGTGASSVPGSLDTATLQSFLSVSPTAILDGTETTDTLTWSFNSGTEAFDFLANGETLILTYSVSATDDDGTSLSDTETVTVTITGTNDGPAASVDTGTANESGGVANATTGNDATGNVLTNDTDSDVTDSLTVVGVAAGSQGSASGSVASDVVGTFGTIQISSNGSYTFVVDENNATVQGLRTTSDTLQDVFTYTIEDSNGANSTAEITVTIRGANDNPHDLATTGLTVIETANNGTSVGTITHSDVDSGDTATFTLTDDANGRFAIDLNTGEVTVANTSQLDHETDTTHSITVRVTDTAGASYDETFVVTVTDANEHPVSTPIDSDAAVNEVDENSGAGTSVGITADAFDLDSTNSTVTYSLTSNPDGLFQIDPNTGEVTTSAVAIDREMHGAIRSITVQAASSDGSTATQTFNITINDLNEFNASTPTDSDLGTNEVDENVAIGTTVGVTADAFDLDATNNTITYSLSSNPGGRFQIDSNTGEVTVAGSIDREVSDRYDITVTATSSDTSSASQTFTIFINDLNEFAVVAGGDVDGSINEVNENSAAGTVVGVTVFATDSDATNNNIQYTMSDDAGGRFDVDLHSGVVTVASGSSLNFEDHTSHDIIVRSTSDDGSFIDQTFTIQILDVNEAPVALGDGVYTAIVGQGIELDSPHLLANDIDVDSDPLRVVIIAHPANGTLQIDLNGDVTYTPNAGYFGSDSFSYQADDGSLTSNTATVTIDVIPGSSGGTGGSSGGDGGGDSGGSTGSGDGGSDGDSGSDSGDSSGDSGGDTTIDGNANPVGPGGSTGQSENESTQTGRDKADANLGDGNGSESGEESAGDGSDARGQGVRATSNQSGRVGQRFGFGDSMFMYDILNGENGLLNGLEGDSELSTLLSWHLSDNGSVQINETYDNEEIHVGAVGTTLGLASIGYVLWALRGGMFIATMYAGIPSWRMLDPASLLSAYRGVDGAAQDKVEEMLD
ncbi:protein containing Cadherin domain protein [Rhodopirellula europaea 6C]|uniref:Protein containing Cadherin domain protein n=1 Tax=Rhodopirellula europaea 6C TaxID=1263867 RepID=M2APU8_9BACT|nr:protein containing Cadherin domain protein [Rhodopirellula europaea 6C]